MFTPFNLKHKPFHLFSETEKGQYLAGLIEGDGCFTKYELLITFHRLDRISMENLIFGLKGGIINDHRKGNWSTLRFTQESLKQISQLINGHFVGNSKLIQMKKYLYEERFNLELQKPLYFIDPNSFWISGFMDSDGSCYLSFRHHILKNQVKSYPYIVVEFGQKELLLLQLLAQLFDPPKKIYVGKNKKEVFHKLTFSSQKHIAFWIDFFLTHSLQSRKYWQILELKTVFEKIQLKQHLIPEVLLTIKKHGLKIREIRIPNSSRHLVLPWSWTTVRFRLTLTEMNEIDILIKTPNRLSYKEIGKKYGVSRQTIARYKDNPLYYKQKLKNVTKL